MGKETGKETPIESLKDVKSLENKSKVGKDNVQFAKKDKN